MAIPPLDDAAVFALAKRAHMSNQVARLLLMVSRVVNPRMQLAVGGAVAVGDAGFVRLTEDLGVFARPAGARRLIGSLRAEGFTTFWIADSHGVAYLPEDNETRVKAHDLPTVRIDVLSTVTEPEASAIRTAIVPKTLGVGVRVFRPDHLAAIKFLAGRPKDLMDFDELILLGVDTEQVRYVVSTSDASRVAALMSRIRKLRKAPSGVRDGNARYLSRDEMQAAFRAAVEREAKLDRRPRAGVSKRSRRSTAGPSA